KNPGEPDRTMLFSYEAFSRSIAERRLELLAGTLEVVSQPLHSALREDLLGLPCPKGIAIPPGPGTPRPGSVSLADAAKVADDFRLLKSTRQTVQEFLELFDSSELLEQLQRDYLNPKQSLLIVSDPSKKTDAGDVLRIYDSTLRSRMALLVDLSRGYRM